MQIVISGKVGKAAALPKCSDTLTLSQLLGADYAQPLALPDLKNFLITTLIKVNYLVKAKSFQVANFYSCHRNVYLPAVNK